MLKFLILGTFTEQWIPGSTFCLRTYMGMRLGVHVRKCAHNHKQLQVPISEKKPQGQRQHGRLQLVSNN